MFDSPVPLCVCRREALTRATDELQLVERDAQRAASNHAVERRAVEQEAAAVAARNERLEAELADALLQKELLQAKGAMYDEVRTEEQWMTKEKKLLKAD